MAVSACTPGPIATPTPKPSVKPTDEPTGAAVQTPPPRTPLPTPLPGEPRTELYLENVQLPTALQWAPDGRLFFAEVAKGTVRIAKEGVLQEEPFLTLKIARRKETGVLGLALDPNFATNRYVYVYFTAPGRGDEPRENRVERFTEQDGKATDRKLIIEDLPVGICCHNGGRLAFGPDGKLYITVGDVNERRNVQNVRRLHGKVLRLNADGTIPEDNPFPGSPVYALGFRNPWGLAFHPVTGRPYISENGPDNHDEVNLIMPGANYGNPDVEGRVNDPRFIDPVWDSGEDRIAPTGLMFYSGNLMPQFKNDMFFCGYNAAALMRVRLTGPDFDQVESIQPVADDCHLDAANGPDGAIYISSITKISRFAPPR